MALNINRKKINEIDFYGILHDCIVTGYLLNDNKIELSFLDDSSNTQKTYKMLIDFGKKPFDYINSYIYRIKKGKIKGKIIEFEDFITTKTKFQLIDIYFAYSTLVIKGSVIKNGMQNREIVLVEFNFEDDSFCIDFNNQ